MISTMSSTKKINSSIFALIFKSAAKLIPTFGHMESEGIKNSKKMRFFAKMGKNCRK